MFQQDLLNELRSLSNKEKARNLQRFFKTGPGEYGEGDIFLGINVPNIRKVAKKYQELDFKAIEKLIKNPAHEVRMCVLFILVLKCKTDPQKAYEIYLRNIKYINNWDLVDLTADRIVGAYLANKNKVILEKLAKSKLLWARRIAIMSTFHFIKNGEAKYTLKIAKILLYDKHDLIHKAVGWMLREIGKRCSQKEEEIFLMKYATQMPRTMLRYAIEKFPTEKRKYYLSLK